jgi:phosphohistidine phosphatase
MTLKKTLLLMRHGEAKDAAPGASDFERPLTPHGDAVVRAQATVMMDKNLWPDVVLVSSSTRTRQTADLLRMAWEGDMEPMIENRTDLYNAAPDAVIHMIRAQDPNYSTAMVIGHNPVVHQLSLSLLKTGELDKFPSLKNTFQPATCVVLQLAMRSWAELGPQKAELSDLLTPPKP